MQAGAGVLRTWPAAAAMAAQRAASSVASSSSSSCCSAALRRLPSQHSVLRTTLRASAPPSWLRGEPSLQHRSLSSLRSAKHIAGLASRFRLRPARAVLAAPPPASKPPPRFNDDSDSFHSFEALGVAPELLNAVDALELREPTEIQAAAIPAILAGGDVLCASHTGSGKTLAYLLPIVQRLRYEEHSQGITARPRRPRCLVLTPTRELTQQVLGVAKSISHHARFRSSMVGGGARWSLQAETLAMPLDIVVGTPGRLLQHAAEGHMYYGDVRYLVLDEADTMFDQGFGPEVAKIITPLRNTGQRLQTVLVTATLTKPVQKLLSEQFPKMRNITTSSLHKGISSARHHFMDVAGNEDKRDVLLSVLHQVQRTQRRAMVFCNTVASCRAVDHFLRDARVATYNYHGEVPALERKENLALFREGGDDPDGVLQGSVLVCTDLAARGLDCDVANVINFDFPLNAVDYLHRTGRTARAGKKGDVTSLVTKRDVLLAKQIKDALAKGESLDGLTSSRAVYEAAQKKRAEEVRKVTLPSTSARRPTTSRAAAKERATSPGRKPSLKPALKPALKKVAGEQGAKAVPAKGLRGAARFEGPGYKKQKPVDTTMKSKRR